VSVSSSLLIADVLEQRQVPPGALEPVPTDLLVALRAVSDPRCRRGTRHRFNAVLGLAVCAVLAGARSYTAIAEWAQDLTPTVGQRLGLGRLPPCESTIRRVLQRLDGEHLSQVVSDWLAATALVVGAPRPALRVIAVDGKTARGRVKPIWPHGDGLIWPHSEST